MYREFFELVILISKDCNLNYLKQSAVGAHGVLVGVEPEKVEGVEAPGRKKLAHRLELI
jgi:hypothetical protein